MTFHPTVSFDSITLKLLICNNSNYGKAAKEMKGEFRAVYSPELPKGFGLALEVENVDELYQHVREKKLPIKTELNNFNWGQRGLVVFVYSVIPG